MAWSRTALPLLVSLSLLSFELYNRELQNGLKTQVPQDSFDGSIIVGTDKVTMQDEGMGLETANKGMRKVRNDRLDAAALRFSCCRNASISLSAVSDCNHTMQLPARNRFHSC